MTLTGVYDMLCKRALLLGAGEPIEIAVKERRDVDSLLAWYRVFGIEITTILGHPIKYKEE